MEDAWKKELGQLLASTRDATEMQALLQELLTPKELETLAERVQIVKALLKGKTQREVRDHLHVAIATVSRGARMLHGQGRILRKRLLPPQRKSTS